MSLGLRASGAFWAVSVKCNEGFGFRACRVRVYRL